MFSIDLLSRCPVYEQLIEQTEKFVLVGVLKGGDKMPSVRNLSVSLSVNPNTIQRAFSELDLKGIIVTVPGKGAFISEDAKKRIEDSRRKNISKLEEDINELRLAGITRDEIYSVIDKIYDERKNTND